MVSGFGAATGVATPTAEIPLARNTSARFDLGRNFANKLWNATRFALSNLAVASGDVASASGRPAVPATLLDRWMLARLERASRLYDEAVSEYQFHRVAEVVYDLVWRDFCDWYLEGVKPTIRTNPTQQAILAASLDAILRMLHPICPFVTETLWPNVQGLGKGRVEGVELSPSALCATASWPRFAATLRDEQALAEFARVQALVDCIRKVRGERQVPPKRRIALLAGDSVRALVASSGGVVETLAGLESVGASPASRPGSAVAVPFEGSELLLDGLVDAVDAGAEKARLSKLIAEREKQAVGMRSKLENAAYIAKAPPALVEETRKKLAEVDADIAAAKQALAALS
jgi:valyl-tRNA synthetase